MSLYELQKLSEFSFLKGSGSLGGSPSGSLTDLKKKESPKPLYLLGFSGYSSSGRET